MNIGHGNVGEVIILVVVIIRRLGVDEINELSISDIMNVLSFQLPYTSQTPLQQSHEQCQSMTGPIDVPGSTEV